MAATASAYGLRPVKMLADRPWNHSLQRYRIASAYATAIYKGDVVKIIADGTIEKDTGTSTATPIGVFMGVQYTDPATKWMYFKDAWPASTVASDAYAYVASDPDLIFEIQAGATVAAADLWGNIALVQGAGNATTSVSGVTAGTSVAATATLPLRVVGFVDRPGSAVGDAFTDIFVIWNRDVVTHQLRDADGLTT